MFCISYGDGGKKNNYVNLIIKERIVKEVEINLLLFLLQKFRKKVDKYDKKKRENRSISILENGRH
jgi:hypothetical protein